MSTAVLLDNRLRYPLEVFNAIREAVGNTMAVGVRLSATDWVEGGWDGEQSIQFSQQLEALGSDSYSRLQRRIVAAAVDHRRTGLSVAIRPRHSPAGCHPGDWRGLITDPQQAEAALEDGDADLIALARAVLYDPHWPWHAAASLGAQVRVLRSTCAPSHTA